MSLKSDKIDFKYTIIDKKLCSINIEIEVSKDVVTNEVESAFNQIRQQAKIDGFRQGKIPTDIVKRKFDEKAKNEAVRNIINKTVLNALEKEEFATINFPIVEEFNYEFGEVLKYRFSAERHPKIDVKDYKGIPIKKEVFKVTDKSLDERLNTLREKNAKLVPSKSGEVTESSFVFVDYNAFDIDGKVLAEITAENYMFDLGSKNIIKEFKEALKSSKVEDERIVEIKYQADYPNKTLAGKTVTFKIKVREIKEKELPELNDDFAKDLETGNLEDLKIKLEKYIEAEEKLRQDIDVEKQIIEYLVDKNKFEVPQCLVADQEKSLIEKRKSYVQNQGIPKEYIEKQIEREHGKFKEEAEKKVRLSYILNAIYKSENLSVTDFDIEAEKNKMKTSNPDKEAATDKYFSEKKEDILVSLKEKKLFDFLISNAKIEVVEKDMH
jgi:trigger factor